MLNKVSKITGYSKESVRGNLIGFQTFRLMGTLYFKDKWVFCRGPSRFIRKGHEKPGEVYKVNYNTKDKKLAREKIFKTIKNKKKPVILTLAGEEGHCVKQLRKNQPKSIIYNVEYNPEVLDTYRKKRLKTKDFSGTISKFIKENQGLKLDLIYYDSLSYACGYMDEDFKRLNRNKNSEYIAITLLGIKNFRSSGEFVDWAKTKFGKSSDPTLQWLKYRLKNYKCIDKFYYSRDPKNHSRQMRVLLFKRGK